MIPGESPIKDDAVVLAVIAAAPLLHDPWMIALQAALGGLMIGTRLDRLRQDREYMK